MGSEMCIRDRCHDVRTVCRVDSTLCALHIGSLSSSFVQQSYLYHVHLIGDSRVHSIDFHKSCPLSDLYSGVTRPLARSHEADSTRTRNSYPARRRALAEGPSGGQYPEAIKVAYVEEMKGVE